MVDNREPRDWLCVSKLSHGSQDVDTSSSLSSLNSGPRAGTTSKDGVGEPGGSS